MVGARAKEARVAQAQVSKLPYNVYLNEFSSKTVLSYHPFKEHFLRYREMATLSHRLI